MDYGKIISLIITAISNSGAIADLIKAIVASLGQLLGLLGVKQPNTDVAWVQRALKKLGFDPGPLDGKLGPLTQKAIVAYQTARSLDVDGWLGPETMTKLQGEAGEV